MAWLPGVRPIPHKLALRSLFWMRQHRWMAAVSTATALVACFLWSGARGVPLRLRATAEGDASEVPPGLVAAAGAAIAAGGPAAGAAAGAAAGGAAGAAAIELVPQMAEVEDPGGGDPIHALWQRPPGALRAAVLLLHGCAHQATDFWPHSNACTACLGLPEEISILRTVLGRGMLAIAVTSADRESGCWRHPDMARIESAFGHVEAKERLRGDIPIYAFGASSGGAATGQLAGLPGIGRRLKCRIPQIMAVPGTPTFEAELPGGETAKWAAPPTLFIHMPRDQRTVHRLAMALPELQAGGVIAAELHCDPEPITGNFFASRVEGVTAEQSRALAEALKTAGFVNDQGFLLGDPRRSAEWRDALMKTGVPGALDDMLQPDQSRLNEEMNVAWAMHEMCATHAGIMLDFCEDPAGTCVRHGWKCGPAAGAGGGGGGGVAVLAGRYADPQHAGSSREVKLLGGGRAEVSGGGGDGEPAKFVLPAAVAVGEHGQATITVDFSPKGGPPKLQGVWDKRGIAWPDGNRWPQLGP